MGRGFKGVCLILLAVSACMGIFFAKKPVYDVETVDRIIEEYRSDPETVKERYNELKKAYEEYRELLFSEIDMDIAIPEWMYEFEHCRLAFERIDRQSTYINKLDKTINELTKEQTSISDDRHIINEMLKGVYEKNKTLRLGSADINGLEDLFRLLPYLLLPIMLAGAFLGATVAFSDRQRGSELLFYSTVYGRRHTLAAKTAACVVCCTVLSVLSTVISVTVYSFASGFGAFTEYIQNCSSFALYPVPLTVLEAIFIILAFTVLSCLFVCTVSCTVGKYSKNRVFPLVCSAVIIVLNFIIGFKDPNVAGSVFNISSLTALCDGNTLFSHIFAVVICGKVIYGMAIIPALYAVCTVIMCTVFILHRSRPIGYKSVLIPMLHLTPRHTRIRSVYSYEWKKQLFANKTLLLLVAAVLIKVYVSVTVYSFELTYTEQKYHSYMMSLEGEYTAEKQEKLDSELAKLNDILSQKEEMERKYRAGEITRKEMGSYLADFYDAQQNEKALAKACNRLSYIRSQIENGKQPSVLYDTGWNELLAFSTDVWLVVLIIAAMCGMYSDEYKNGMNKLYAVCNKKALHRAKAAFCIGFSVISTIVFSAVETIIIADKYTLPLYTAKASSIEGISFIDSVPLFAYLIIQISAKCVLICAFAFIVAFLSKLTKNKVLTFLISLSLMIVMLLLT